MNIKEELYAYLRSRGCSLREEAGIVYVIMPSGVVWVMTVPQVNKKLSGTACAGESDGGFEQGKQNER